MYRNGVDAMKELLGGRVSASGVAAITPTIGPMSNGITRCVVQITLSNGEEYRIEAYGDEAGQLWEAASEHSALLCLH